MVNCGRRWGKALEIDTPIPTPNGWKFMGDLGIGDSVFDENGSPCKIIGATGVMFNRPCYKVSFSDGTSIVADANHQWFTWTKVARKEHQRRKTSRYKDRLPLRNPNSFPGVVTTEEIASTLHHGKKKESNHSVPLCGPVQYEEKEFLVDPYVLGCWLGDGNSGDCILTCIGDEEILANAANAGYSISFTSSSAARGKFSIGRKSLRSGTSVLGDNLNDESLRVSLRKLGVLNSKHIPGEYLKGSVEQRLSLLQGLMDTDGSVEKNGNCEFCNTNKHVAYGVLDLCRSLGIKATILTGVAKLNGKECGAKYRVSFTTDVPVFRLTRKLNRIKKSNRWFWIHHRYIVNVEPVKSVPVKCIEVDSPNHLYLAGHGYIPTHNSLMGRDRLVNIALQGFPTGWFSPNNKILADSWREMKGALAALIEDKREDDHRVGLKGGGSIEMWSLESEDAGRSRKYASVVVDEAAMVQKLETFWNENIRPTLTDYRGNAWFMSTPKGMNYFKVLFDRGGDPDPKWKDWASWQMPTVTNPYISPEEIENARIEMTEAAFNQEYLALFVNWEGSVFRNIEECATGHFFQAPIPGHEYVFGVDWGRSKDYTVIMVIDVTGRAVAFYDRFSQVDYKLQRDRLRVLRDKWHPSRILAENNSIGEPIIEQLEVEGIPIDRFVTTNASKQEAIQHLALSFERADIILPNDSLLLSELVAFQGTILPSGMTRYSAPEGGHDDMVMALAVGWSAVHDGNRYGALEYLKSEYNLIPATDTAKDAKLVAKVSTSQEIKPAVAKDTASCPSCNATCVVKIGGTWRCNQCGLETRDIVILPPPTNRSTFQKGLR